MLWHWVGSAWSGSFLITRRHKTAHTTQSQQERNDSYSPRLCINERPQPAMWIKSLGKGATVDIQPDHAQVNGKLNVENSLNPLCPVRDWKVLSYLHHRYSENFHKKMSLVNMAVVDNWRGSNLALVKLFGLWVTRRSFPGCSVEISASQEYIHWSRYATRVIALPG